jgi:hypothetical protein
MMEPDENFTDDLLTAKSPQHPVLAATVPSSNETREFVRRPRLWGIIVLLTIQVLLSVYSLAFGSKPAEQKWEYQIVALPDVLFDKQLNELGKDGWELVSARRASNGSTYSPIFSYEMILKRPARIVQPK